MKIETGKAGIFVSIEFGTMQTDRRLFFPRQLVSHLNDNVRDGKRKTSKIIMEL